MFRLGIVCTEMTMKSGQNYPDMIEDNISMSAAIDLEAEL